MADFHNPYMTILERIQRSRPLSIKEMVSIAKLLNEIEFKHYEEPRLLPSGHKQIPKEDPLLTILGDSI